MSIKSPKTILAFDLDGTLTVRNQFKITPNGLAQILNELDKRSHYSIPVTGKPVSYAANLFPTNQLADRGIVAENAGVYRKPENETVEVYGPSLPEMKALRNLLGIGMDKVNVANIKIFDKEYEVVIDPGDVSILTVFTEPSTVKHRWIFNKAIDAYELVEKLKVLVIENSWEKNLEVLAPFPDGGVQVIRKDPETGLSVDKSSLVFALHKMYPQLGNVPIAMFGDGHNDIPAMKPNGIIPITFHNSHDEVIKFVQTRDGYVSKYDTPEGLGVVDGLIWLAEKDFFGEEKDQVIGIIKNIFKGF